METLHAARYNVLQTKQTWNTNSAIPLIYSVLQSDGNKFCGDVVSGSFNKIYHDEEKILDQIYKSKYVCIIIMMILIIILYENAY